MAEREELITRLWARGAKSDVERFKMNWHTFKMRLRRVDASSIHTCCELIQRIRDKAAQDNAPKLEAAAKRHKQAIDTKTPACFLPMPQKISRNRPGRVPLGVR